MAEGARRLLGPDEPAPVWLLRSDGRADFVLTADHAGRAIPRALSDLGLPESERLRHIAWDIGIAAVTERLAAALDAVAVMQRYSRLVIDCNRESSVEASIPPLSEATTIPGNIGLAAEQREARRREIFAPYHAAIAHLLDARRAAGRRTVLVAMHSFTPIFKGVPRRVEVGVLYNPDARDIRMQQILLNSGVRFFSQVARDVARHLRLRSCALRRSFARLLGAGAARRLVQHDGRLIAQRGVGQHAVDDALALGGDKGFRRSVARLFALFHFHR